MSSLSPVAELILSFNGLSVHQVMKPQRPHIELNTDCTTAICREQISVVLADQPQLKSIRQSSHRFASAFAFSDFGKCRFSIPSAYPAHIFICVGERKPSDKPTVGTLDPVVLFPIFAGLCLYSL